MRIATWFRISAAGQTKQGAIRAVQEQYCTPNDTNFRNRPDHAFLDDPAMLPNDQLK